MKIFWWLYPGLKIKRWAALIGLGLLLLTAGSASAAWWLAKGEGLTHAGSEDLRRAFTLFLLLGMLATIVGILGLGKSVFRLARGDHGNKNIGELAYERSRFSKGLKVVAFGGGTGLSNLLYGIKHHTREITAVTTMADDGGSSGRLRMDLDMPPPGDIRNCLVALADTEPIVNRMFQYRFEESELAGHSFGNLFLTALTKITGSFDEAVREATKILAVRGRVIPSTTRRVSLVAIHEDGTKSTGQNLIAHTTKRIHSVELRPNPGPVREEILTAIREADIIIYGPGSLFTSVLPNLVLEGIGAALAQATARKFYVCNIVTQEGETSSFTVSHHVDALLRHLPPGSLDTVIVNNGAVPPVGINEAPLTPVVMDVSTTAVVELNFVQEDLVSAQNPARHDPYKLARVIFDYAGKNRNNG